MSFFAIINPASGKKTKKNFENQLKEAFFEKKLLLETAYTQSKGHGTELALRAIKNGCKTIIAVGGDGTIREAAFPLINKSDLSLGIIPAGSGNGLARNLCITMDIKKSIEGLFSWGIRKIDVGLCNGDIFFNACGFSIDAEIAKEFNRPENKRGILPYFLAGIKSFLNYKPKLIRFNDDKEIKSFFPLLASAMNGRQYGGGAILNPDGKMDDGLLEMVVAENMSFIKAIFKLRHIFNGKAEKKKIIKTFSFKNAEILLGINSVYHLDGEDFFSADGRLKISVLERSVNVIAPL